MRNEWEYKKHIVPSCGIGDSYELGTGLHEGWEAYHVHKTAGEEVYYLKRIRKEVDRHKKE